MSFVKAAFLIVLILFLLPSNRQENFELYSTAQRTLADIGGFCGRNPDVCERVSLAFQGALRRLKSASDTVEDMLNNAGIGASREDERGRHSAYDEHQQRSVDHVGATSSTSSDTLTGRDRSPAWRGPHGI